MTAQPEFDACDVAVIGGGAVGLWAALELAARGQRVVVLERARAGSGASFGNAGWLTPSLASPLAAPGHLAKLVPWMLDPESPFHVRLSLEPALWFWLARFLLASRSKRFERGTRAMVELCRWSVDAWERAAAEEPDFGFARRGLLMLLESEAAARAARGHAERTAEWGVPFEWWPAERVRAEEPIVRGPLLGALHYPDDAHCEPNLALEHLAARVRAAGVRLLEDTPVTGAERRGRRVVALATGRGRLVADRVVLAAGAWSGELARDLGLVLAMRAAKGYSLILPAGEPHPTRSLYLAERKVTVTPHRASLRLAGTLELVGIDLAVSERRVAAILRAARAMLALGAREPSGPPWAGLRPCLPSGMPVIGPAPGSDNLWLATGHQMTGLKCAPGSARLLAELMAGERPSFDPAPFAA